MSSPGSKTLSEISAQPAALQAAWDQVESRRDWVAAFIGNPAFDETIFIGSGSSYYQALTMAAAFRRWTGRRASAMPSSEVYLFRDAAVARQQQVLLVGVSRSGESTEVLLAVESVKPLPNWAVCGITCYGDSSLARLADCLVSPLGREESTVMTKSFSSMTFMMLAAIAAAAGDRDAARELAEVVRLDEDVVRRADAFVQTWSEIREPFGNTIFLGMGAYGGLAQEACLKLKEMANVWTEAYGTLEFRHGPKAIVGPGTLVCVLLSEQARAFELKVAEEMKAFGATVWLIAARADDDTAFADGIFVLGGEALSDEARAVLYLPPVQYFGCRTALNRGVDPDHPKNLTQVVVL